MKKSLISLAIAAGMAASGAALAGDADVYGNVHLSLNAADSGVAGADDNLTMSSNTSSIGVKGSEDLGNGAKALYKVEFGVDILDKVDTTPDTGAPHSSTGTFNGRDQWVGLKGGMGTVKFGTMSSNYKQLGGKVDPLYRTVLEGRGFLMTQSSALHGGRGINRGRQTNTVQYESPEMGGMQLVVNTTFSGSGEETTGVGFRYEGKGFMAYVDWIDGQTAGTAAACVGAAVCTTEAATKVGGKFKAGPVTLGAQFESAEDRTGSDYTFLSANYGIDSNNQVILTAGQRAAKAANSDSDGVAIAYNHKLSKQTNVYAGYGDRSDDVGSGESIMTFGIRKKF